MRKVAANIGKARYKTFVLEDLCKGNLFFTFIVLRMAVIDWLPIKPVILLVTFLILITMTTLPLAFTPIYVLARFPATKSLVRAAKATKLFSSVLKKMADLLNLQEQTKKRIAKVSLITGLFIDLFLLLELLTQHLEQVDISLILKMLIDLVLLWQLIGRYTFI